MGAGIAYSRRRPVIDVVLNRPRPGLGRQGQEHRRRWSQGRSSAAGHGGREGCASRQDPRHADYADLAGADLVIEAVFEDRDVKAEATQRRWRQLSGEAIFASNTSTLPITSLAEVYKDPKRFSGFISSRRSTG